MNFQFLRYVQPLIQGEIVVPHDNGVPLYARLDRVVVDKVLPPYEVLNPRRLRRRDNRVVAPRQAWLVVLCGDAGRRV